MGDGHVDDIDQIVAVALEALVRADPQVHIEVAVAAAPDAHRAPTGEAKRGSVVDASRNVDRVGPFLGAPPLPAAVRARAGDLLSRAIALRARRRGHHLAEDRPPDSVDLAAAAALPAGDRRRARTGAAALAVRTGNGLAQSHLALHTEDGLFEGELDRDFHVGPPPGTALVPSPERRPTAEGATEEGLEQIAEPRTEGTAVEAASGRGGRLGTKEVVATPALRVTKRLVGLCDLLEAILGRGVAPVGVRMELSRQAPVGALDLVFAGVGADLEQLVVIDGHQADRVRPRRSLTTATAAMACG